MLAPCSKVFCVQIAEIIKRFESKGYRLVGIKIIVPTSELASKHYDEHNGKYVVHNTSQNLMLLYIVPVMSQQCLHVSLSYLC